MRAQDVGGAGGVPRPRALRPLGLLILAAVVVAAAAPLGVTASSPSPPPTTATVAAPTAAPLTTDPAPPEPTVDLLADTNWLLGTYPSPCGDGDVALLAGSAIVGDERIVLDDVRRDDQSAGSAVVFLSCRTAGGATRAQTVAVVAVAADGTMRTIAEQDLPAESRIVSIRLPNIVIEVPDGRAPTGSCCTALIRRQAVTVSPEAITLRDYGQRSAFDQTVLAAPVVGASAELVRKSAPATALCFGWSGAYYPQDPPEEPEPPTPASADIET